MIHSELLGGLKEWIQAELVAGGSYYTENLQIIWLLSFIEAQQYIRFCISHELSL